MGAAFFAPWDCERMDNLCLGKKRKVAPKMKNLKKDTEKLHVCVQLLGQMGVLVKGEM